MEQISLKYHSIQTAFTNCGLKDLLLWLFSLSKISIHNKVWGSVEIMANLVETLGIVNMLHPLTEVFHLLLLRVSKLQSFIALPLALDSLCNIILSLNAKAIIIFIVRVKSRTSWKRKKKEYERILILFNVLLQHTIIWTLFHNKAFLRLENSA